MSSDTRTPLLIKDESLVQQNPPTLINSTSSFYQQPQLNPGSEFSEHPSAFASMAEKSQLQAGDEQKLIDKLSKLSLIEQLEQWPSRFVSYEQIYSQQDVPNKVFCSNSNTFYIKDNLLFTLEYSDHTLDTYVMQKQPNMTLGRQYSTMMRNPKVKSLMSNFYDIVDSQDSQITKTIYGDQVELKIVQNENLSKFIQLEETSDTKHQAYLNVYSLPNLKLIHKLKLNFIFKMNDTKLNVSQRYISIYSQGCAFVFRFNPLKPLVKIKDCKLITYASYSSFRAYFRNENIDVIQMGDLFFIKSGDQIIKKLISQTDDSHLFQTFFFEKCALIFDYGDKRVFIFDYIKGDFINHKICKYASNIKEWDYYTFIRSSQSFQFTDKSNGYIYFLNESTVSKVDDIDKSLKTSYIQEDNEIFKLIDSFCSGGEFITDQQNKRFFYKNNFFYMCDYQNNEVLLHKFDREIDLPKDDITYFIHNNHNYCMLMKNTYPAHELENIHLGNLKPVYQCSSISNFKHYFEKSDLSQSKIQLIEKQSDCFKIILSNQQYVQQALSQFNKEQIAVQGVQDDNIFIDKRFAKRICSYHSIVASDQSMVYHELPQRIIDKNAFYFTIDMMNKYVIRIKKFKTVKPKDQMTIKVSFSISDELPEMNEEQALLMLRQSTSHVTETGSDYIQKLDVRVFQQKSIRRVIAGYENSLNFIVVTDDGSSYLVNLMDAHKNRDINRDKPDDDLFPILKNLNTILEFSDTKLVYLKYNLTSLVVLNLQDGKIISRMKKDLSKTIKSLFGNQQSYEAFYKKRSKSKIQHYYDLRIKDKIILKIENFYIFLDNKTYNPQGVLEFLNISDFQQTQTDLLECQNDQLVINQCHINDTIFISSHSIDEFIMGKANPFGFKVQIDLKNCIVRHFDAGSKLICEYYYQMPLSFQEYFINTLNLDEFQQREFINSLQPNQLFTYFGRKSMLDIMHKLPISSIQLIINRMMEFDEFKYPLVLFDRMQSKDTSLDIAIKEKDIQRIQIYLSLIMKNHDNPVFNFVLDRNLNSLLKIQTNLREYFESQLCFVSVDIKQNFSSSEDTIITADFDQNLNILEIMEDYENIMKLDEQEADSDEDTRNILTQNYVINIPETIRDLEFIENLTNYDNIEIFETTLIQSVIDYKWRKYTKSYFKLHFAYFLVFLTLIIFDIYFFVIQRNPKEEEKEFKHDLVSQYIIKGGWAKNYLSEFFNYGDLAIIATYMLTSILDIMDTVPVNISILYSILLILSFIKLTAYLRLYKGFSFLVSMIEAVFLDLKFFIALYSMVLALYAMIFTLLLAKPGEVPEEYQGIGLIGFFVMSFRTSMGDFQVDDYNTLSKSGIIFAWIIWLTGVLFLNIILLNFIIAVISESYEKVMQKMVAQSYLQQAMLIKEREMHFSEKQKQSFKYFPRFLILRRPVQQDSQENNEWHQLKIRSIPKQTSS
eukprot:403349897